MTTSTPPPTSDLIDYESVRAIINATTVSVAEAGEAIAQMAPYIRDEMVTIVLLAPDDVLRDMIGRSRPRPWWRFWR